MILLLKFAGIPLKSQNPVLNGIHSFDCNFTLLQVSKHFLYEVYKFKI